jgi:biotin carboxyl carrier protein
MRASVLQCELFQLSERVKQMRFHLERGNLMGARRQALVERLRKTRQQQSTLKWILREAVENYYREQHALQQQQPQQQQQLILQQQQLQKQQQQQQQQQKKKLQESKHHPLTAPSAPTLLAA